MTVVSNGNGDNGDDGTIVNTALHCLNSRMYAYMYILLGKVRTLLEWADELLSKKWSGVDGVYGLDGVDTL